MPLICARELDVVGGTPHCIRVLMHLSTDRSRADPDAVRLLRVVTTVDPVAYERIGTRIERGQSLLRPC